MSTYQLVARDGNSIFQAVIRNSATQALVDLTGKTVQLRYQLNGGSTIEKTMTVLSQITNMGEAEYRFLPADLPAGGTISGEVRLQAGLSDQLTTVDTFHLSVREPLSEVVA